MDPPYIEKNLSTLLTRIIESDILKKSGILIIHRHKHENDEFPNKFNVLEEKTYEEYQCRDEVAPSKKPEN